jgi:hypothetical protein
MSNIGEVPDGLVNTGSTDGDTPTTSIEVITCAAHRQQNNLLGLALQTFNNSVAENEMNVSITFIQGVPDEKTAACPIHGALLAALNADAVTC